jgi:hypothetical protein
MILIRPPWAGIGLADVRCARRPDPAAEPLGSPANATRTVPDLASR